MHGPYKLLNIEDSDDVKLLTEYCNKAYDTYAQNREAYFDENDENHAKVRKEVHDLHEKMMRVLISGYVLPEKYEFPSITHRQKISELKRKEKRESKSSAEKVDTTTPTHIYTPPKFKRFQPPTQQHYLPTERGWGFHMVFEGVHVVG